MHHVFAILFALVWLVNGLGCKVLGLVPRHRAIVARILGEKHASFLTRLIGLAEIVMALWIFSRWQWRCSCVSQIIVVSAMNVIEFRLAPDLLLFRRRNILVAAAYVALVACAGFLYPV